ncbi:MAG: biotin transporter BioY [Anaerolineae bacterium]
MHSLVLHRTATSRWVRVLGILVFAIAMAVSARTSVVTPFSPVPLTFQVLLVVLCGFVLGARDGFIAQILYLQAILLGAPLTATGLAGPLAFVSPTAGYLLAFPVAAALAGWISQNKTSLRPLWTVLGGLGALVAIYTLGMIWLSAFVGGLGNAWKFGVLPFVGIDLLKVVIAAAIVSLRRR